MLNSSTHVSTTNCMCECMCVHACMCICVCMWIVHVLSIHGECLLKLLTDLKHLILLPTVRETTILNLVYILILASINLRELLEMHGGFFKGQMCKFSI